MLPEETKTNVADIGASVVGTTAAEIPSPDGEKLVARRPDGTILPGVVLNPKGNKGGGKWLTTLLKEALIRTDVGEDTPNDRAIIEMVIKRARRGDLSAAAMVWGRIEGSVPTTIIHEGDGLASLNEEQKKRLNALLGIEEPKAEVKVDSIIPTA